MRSTAATVRNCALPANDTPAHSGHINSNSDKVNEGCPDAPILATLTPPMITDLDRKMLVPSLAEVLASLKNVPAPYTRVPQHIKVPIEDALEMVAAMDGFKDRQLQRPTIELEKMRVVKDGQESEVWRVVRMPDFYLG